MRDVLATVGTMSDYQPAPWRWAEGDGRRWLVDANGAPVRTGRVVGDQIVDTPTSETQRLAPELEAQLRFALRVLKELAEDHEATDDLEANQALAQGWGLLRAIDEAGH